MIVVLPFHNSDYGIASELMEWCADLGCCPQHDAILLSDAAVNWDDARNLLCNAQGVFRSATMLATPRPYAEKWPMASNAMWLAGARHVAAHVKTPWLWLEPDAIPLKAGWLEAIDDAYSKCGKLFMGAIVDGNLRGHVFRYLNGVCVYPPNALDIIAPTLTDPQVAWDVAAAKVMLGYAVNTHLIHCFWGEPDLPPTFDPAATGRNKLSLARIPESAVLHHRCKDGSLIAALRRKLHLPVPSTFVVVLSFCNKDVTCLLDTLRWMNRLHGPVNYSVLLAHPSDTVARSVTDVRAAAARIFNNIELLRYNGSSVTSWPSGANLAWQSAARWMLRAGTPWLWLEPDAIPLKADWLNRLASAYARHRKPFMGPIVPSRGHMNGVGIYPPDTAMRCPKAMTATNEAWDVQMREEMINDCHDASDLIFHVWCLVNGQPHPFQEGELIHFASWADVQRWIPMRAVLAHRVKDGSLTRLLAQNLAQPVLQER